MIEQTAADEIRLKLMRLLEANPGVTQRDVASAFGISLGKVNYCLKALAQKGWIKICRFKRSRHKANYRYLLTPHGIEQKAALTARFLRLKLREYESLRAEIEQLRQEAAVSRDAPRAVERRSSSAPVAGG